MEKKEDEEGRVKKFHFSKPKEVICLLGEVLSVFCFFWGPILASCVFFLGGLWPSGIKFLFIQKKKKEVICPCSKAKGVVLESEIRFFLGKKEGDPWLLGEEDEWLLFCRIVFFGGERTKVGGLNLRMMGNFSWGINSCFLILSDMTCSYRLNSTSWVESRILGVMVGNKPRKNFFFFLGGGGGGGGGGGVVFNTYNMALMPQCMQGAIVCTQIKIWYDLILG